MRWGSESPRIYLFWRSMTLRKESYRKCERGVTTVEGAVILTMFFMLLFGVIEAGRFLSMRQVLANAAREGARFAVAPTSGTNNLPNETEIQAVVAAFLTAGQVTGATTTTTCPTTAPEACTAKSASMSVNTGLVTTEYTEVAVSKPYSVITVPGFFNAISVTLTGTARMRRETSE
jgi:Flp pilus assembly protein TadG